MGYRKTTGPTAVQRASRQLKREQEIFGPVSEVSMDGNMSDLAMITIRIHPKFRNELGRMALAKRTSINNIVRELLLREYTSWKGASNGSTKDPTAAGVQNS